MVTVDMPGSAQDFLVDEVVAFIQLPMLSIELWSVDATAYAGVPCGLRVFGAV